MHYQDGMDRKTEEIFPVGWNLMAYPSTSVFDAYTAVADTSPSTGCTSCRHTQVLLDAWGRKSSEVLVNNPIGAVNIDTTYDTTGRVQSTSHAYTGSSDPNHVFETFGYDALNRKVSVTHPDGQVAQMAYGATVNSLGGLTTQQSSTATYGFGFPAISEDETSKQTQQWVDGFGRIIEVDEPSTSTSTAGSAGIVINLGPGAQSQNFDPCQAGGHGSCPQTAWNQGTISITVNGFTATAGYGQNGPPPAYSTPQSVATTLAAQLNDPSSPVTASAGSQGTVTITAKGPGASGNFAFTTSATYYTGSCPPYNPCFGGPALSPYPASGALSGGSGGIASSPFFTAYTYDAADNLKQVVQGVQTRTFS